MTIPYLLIFLGSISTGVFVWSPNKLQRGFAAGIAALCFGWAAVDTVETVIDVLRRLIDAMPS